MLKSISIKCENGKIQIYWEWNHDDVEGIYIAYKRKEILEGVGTNFTNSIIMRKPSLAYGNAERQLTNESGLYTFTFTPKLINGNLGEKLIYQDIMLGNPIQVEWKLNKIKDGIIISFPELKTVIPSGIAYFKGENFRYFLEYEINEKTKLLLLEKDKVGLRLCFKEPFDKMYRVKQIVI